MPKFTQLVLLLAVSIPTLFIGLGLPLLDPDEGLYAEISREMLKSGAWLVPHFNGLPYLEKPPLYFWLTALTLWIFGSVEWAPRLWSAFPALGSVLLTWRIGRRLYGSTAGLLGALALSTTTGYALYVRKASTDFLFVFCLTLALYGFLRDAEQRTTKRTRFLLFYLGAGLGLLTKGLIGILFPALIVGLTLCWVRRLTIAELNLARGAALFGLVALPWHLAAAWRQPELFWFYLWDNQVLRFLNLRAFLEDDVPISTVGFLVATFIWFFPWVVLLMARREPDPTSRSQWRPMVMIWALVVVGFFVLSRSRLEYYALPAFPALAVLAGAGWAAGRDTGRWLRVGLVGCGAVGLWSFWIGASLTPEQALSGLAELNVYYRILREQGMGFPFESPRPFAWLLQQLGVTLIVGWALAAFCWHRRWRHTAFGALAAMAGVIGLLIVQLLQIVEPHHSAKAVAQAILGEAAADDVIVHEGSLEYSAALPFYTGRRIVVVNGTRGDLDFASRRPEARGFFLDGSALAPLWEGERRLFLVTQRPLEQSVLSRLPADSIHHLGTFGSRWLYSNSAPLPGLRLQALER
jgi:hypothetical protein